MWPYAKLYPIFGRIFRFFKWSCFLFQCFSKKICFGPYASLFLHYIGLTPRWEWTWRERGTKFFPWFMKEGSVRSERGQGNRVAERETMKPDLQCHGMLDYDSWYKWFHAHFSQLYNTFHSISGTASQKSLALLTLTRLNCFNPNCESWVVI